jgi:hypothetical protein
MENEQWINKVAGSNSQDEVQSVVDQLTTDPPASLVGLYSEAQTKAGEYIGRGEDIPQGLVEAINKLARMPTGNAGMTVHETFIGFIRKPR